MRRACATRVQQIPEDATTTGRRLPRGETADPVFPRSAVIGFDSSQLEGLAVARPWGSSLPFRTIINSFGKSGIRQVFANGLLTNAG